VDSFGSDLFSVNVMDASAISSAFDLLRLQLVFHEFGVCCWGGLSSGITAGCEALPRHRCL